MATLLTSYSVGEIILFIVILALAIKGLVEFSHWAWDKMKDRVHRSEKPAQMVKDVRDELTKIEEANIKNLEELKARDNKLQEDIDCLKIIMDGLTDNVKLLINSDKASILAWITQQHHYYMRLGWIDEFSLQTIEKRFEFYKKEGGNGFADDVMQDLRDLPNVSPRDAEIKES